MKKNIVLTSFLFGIFLNVDAQTEIVYSTGPYVYTCNGSQIATISPNRELTALEKADAKAQLLTGSLSHLGITVSDIIEEASSAYNCHAYAWHLTEGNSNNVWINQYRNGNDNLSKYWSDGCFIEAAESQAEKIFYYSGDHSAVKSAYTGKYESKWGQFPVVRHTPTQVPYNYPDNRRYYKKFQCSSPISGTYTQAGSTQTLHSSGNGSNYCGYTGGTVTINLQNISGASYSWAGAITGTGRTKSYTPASVQGFSTTVTRTVSGCQQSATFNFNVTYDIGGCVISYDDDTVSISSEDSLLLRASAPLPQPTGIAETLPAPAKNAALQMRVFDLTGKTVSRNISALPAGIYVIRTVNPNTGEVKTEKILKRQETSGFQIDN